MALCQWCLWGMEGAGLLDGICLLLRGDNTEEARNGVSVAWRNLRD